MLISAVRLLREEAIDTSELERELKQAPERGRTAVFVAIDGRAVGFLAFSDQLKHDAQAVVDALKRSGLAVTLLTGDNRQTACAVVQALGIARVLAEVLPGNKAGEIRRLQAQGEKVAMIGDGINNAPALMQADVGIAIGAGTGIAIEATDVVLLSARLATIVAARDLAARSYQLTTANVALALAFNGVGVIAAANGAVEPVWATLAMAASVSVVLLHSFAGRLLPHKTQPS